MTMITGGGQARLWRWTELRPGHIAIVPRGDLVEHDQAAEASDGCVCGPTVVPAETRDGQVGWLYVHHSLDGREGREGAPGATPTADQR